MLRARGKGDCSHLILAESPLGTEQHTAFEAWHAFSSAQSGGQPGESAAQRLRAVPPIESFQLPLF
jgi:hypothetical protein